MPAFPTFMKSPSNRVVASSQHTPGFEGYVFGQMAFWTVERDAITAERTPG